MTISRGQMNRQLYMGGGIMNARPRQKFFLGGIGDSIKDLGKKAVSGIKDIAKSDIGKAALLYAGTAGLGALGAGRGIGSLAQLGTYAPSTVLGNLGTIGTNFFKGKAMGVDKFDNIVRNQSGLSKIFGGGITGNVGKFAALGAVTTFLTSTLGMSEEQAEEEVARDPSKYLSLYYKNLNPKASEEEVQEFVTSNTSEYAVGGRVNYSEAGPVLPNDTTQPVNPFGPKPGDFGIEEDIPIKMVSNEILEIPEITEEFLEELKRRKIEDLLDQYYRFQEDYERRKDMAPTQEAAMGGRIGYALGDTASQNAMQAASIEGLPMRQNPKGVQELDLRDNGGFIPPVGIKEKEDDIPAMLSNNEFVFTADAVRGMGDGDVELGAQRMYDQMKMLEAGGKV